MSHIDQKESERPDMYQRSPELNWNFNFVLVDD